MQKTQCSVVTYDTVNISFYCVGLKENNFDDLFSVFPNPSNDEIFISAKKDIGETKISLKDISGREIEHFLYTASENKSIKTSSLENGIYFLDIESQTLQIKLTKKVIIQH